MPVTAREDVRSVDEIALPKLIALAREVRSDGLEDEDALMAMARRAGPQKLRQASYKRLERALQSFSK